MPTYAYRCSVCQQTLTLQHGIHEIKTQVCPQCGGIARLVIESSPVVLGNSQKPDADPKPVDHHHGSGCCALHPKPDQPLGY